MIPPEPQNFGFKFPASDSVPVLFSSMVTTALHFQIQTAIVIAVVHRPLARKERVYVCFHSWEMAKPVHCVSSEFHYLLLLLL